jgi:hypothetical protein
LRAASPIADRAWAGSPVFRDHHTDLPIRQISYPSAGLNAGGKGVLLGGYTFDGPNSYDARG